MWKALLEELTEPCSYVNCTAGTINKYKCWSCNGTGRQISEQGREFIAFLKDYCDVAEADHSHYIS